MRDRQSTTMMTTTTELRSSRRSLNQTLGLSTAKSTHACWRHRSPPRQQFLASDCRRLSCSSKPGHGILANSVAAMATLMTCSASLLVRAVPSTLRSCCCSTCSVHSRAQGSRIMPATPATTAGPASMKAIPSTWTKSYPSNSLTMMRPHHVSNSCAIDGPAVSIKAANPSTLATCHPLGVFQFADRTRHRGFTAVSQAAASCRRACLNPLGLAGHDEHRHHHHHERRR
mmetsp:Transcript_53360/g.172304  ORF Transcript_53360/g.172304 Transcript_53360/m.172304 type:complete len:229 (-) Transcript_53360:191-877(-)